MSKTVKPRDNNESSVIFKIYTKENDTTARAHAGYIGYIAFVYFFLDVASSATPTSE